MKLLAIVYLFYPSLYYTLPVYVVAHTGNLKHKVKSYITNGYFVVSLIYKGLNHVEISGL